MYLWIMFVKESRNAVPWFVILVYGQFPASWNSKCVRGAFPDSLVHWKWIPSKESNCHDNPLWNSYRDMYCATRGRQWKLHTPRQYVTHSAEGPFLFLDGLSTWKGHIIFGVRWVLGLPSCDAPVYDPSLCHFHITPSLIYSRSSVAGGGGELISPHLYLDSFPKNSSHCW